MNEETINNLMDSKIFKSHSAISKTVSDFGSELRKVTSDHDQIITLVADVKSIKDSQRDIKESQDKFHNEVKESFKELKDGFITRSEYIEVVKIQNDHETRTRVLEESKYKVLFVTGAITGFLSVAGSYIINLLTK